MPFKSATQPHCLYCRGKIRKWTDNHSWVQDKVYRSLADVQRDHNQKVVHISYDEVRDGTSVFTKAIANGAKVGERVVGSFSTWDGESYEDEFFCNGDHAKRFAYAIAYKYYGKVRQRVS